MTDELIDIYDITMNHLGTAMKSQAHKEGLWHKAFHCWVVKKSADGKHKIWLQLRGKGKENHPNLLDITVAGHLKAGEEAKSGIKEIQKKLGLEVDFSQLTKLFTYTHAADIDDYHNREFNPTYVYATDKEFDDLKMDSDEVDGIYEVELDDMENLMKKKMFFIPALGCRKNEDGTCGKETRSVTMNDLVEHGDKYYLKALETIRRYCDGL